MQAVASAFSREKLIWFTLAVLGAIAVAMVALARGETVSALWLVVAALCCYAIAYRFYMRFIATRVMELDDTRLTPAVRLNDGLDYVPTHKGVLFGHHFAAIAGAVTTGMSNPISSRVPSGNSVKRRATTSAVSRMTSRPQLRQYVRPTRA